MQGTNNTVEKHHYSLKRTNKRNAVEIAIITLYNKVMKNWKKRNIPKVNGGIA